MGKNSGTTRTGGSSNPKGVGRAQLSNSSNSRYEDVMREEGSYEREIRYAVNELEEMTTSEDVTEQEINEAYLSGVEAINSYSSWAAEQLMNLSGDERSDFLEYTREVERELTRELEAQRNDALENARYQRDRRDEDEVKNQL